MNKSVKKLLISAILVLVGGGISYYVTLPVLNPRSAEFWGYLTFILLLALLPFALKNKTVSKKSADKGFYVNIDLKTLNLPVIAAIILPLVVILVGNLTSATIFNAKRYASLIDVEEAVFEEDMPQTNDVTNIALMDTSSAII